MKKIKKFRINLRLREIIKNLKIITQTKEITSQLEEAVKKEMARAGEYLTPACMFETVKPGPEGETGSVSISYLFVTLGEAIEKEIDACAPVSETIRSNIIHSIGLDGIEVGLNFIYKLLLEEAGKEECELRPLTKLTGNRVKAVFDKINPGRIGIRLNDNNELQPFYTAVASVEWVPVIRGKK